MRQMIIMLMLLVSGCVTSSTMKFRVIDGESRPPLRGVQVTRNSRMLFPTGKKETVALEPTDKDGIVTVNDIRSNHHHWLTFQSAGYGVAVATVDTDHDPVVTSPVVPGSPVEALLVYPAEGVYVIPMYPNAKVRP